MKINEIIVEARVAATSDDEIAQIIRRDCAPFLAMINNQVTENRLWRGARQKFQFFTKQPCPVNRKPLDTIESVSKIVDSWFFETTGIKFRSNATFATGDITVTENYGAPFTIFPIGEFSFCWSPTVGDLTYDLLDQVGLSPDNPETIKTALEEQGNYILNNDMQEAIRSGHEIMIHCPHGFYTLANTENEMSKNFDRDTAILDLIENPNQAVNVTRQPNDQDSRYLKYIEMLQTKIAAYTNALSAPLDQRAAIIKQAGADEVNNNQLTDDSLRNIASFWQHELARCNIAQAKKSMKAKS